MKLALLAMTVLLFFPFAAHAAQPVFDYSSFRMMPVLDAGRIKPLDSYARIRLKEISGSESNAVAWISETLFDPATAARRPLFYVPAQDIKTQLGLDAARQHFTIYEIQSALRKTDVRPLLKIPEANLTPAQKQILYLAENALAYDRLLRGEPFPTLKKSKKMARAWRAGDISTWQNVSREILIQQTGFSLSKFRLEVFYNLLKPFHVALVLYCVSFILFLIARTPIIFWGKAALGIGLTAHAFGILARIIVLSRPPVGTLYEAVLFVSFICAAAGFFMFIRKKNRPALFSGLLAAIALLSLAPAMLQTGESMEMLVAVLNTNFWLGTHVLCITGGYGLSILTGCLAHYYLFSPSKSLQKNLYAFSIAALLLTATGTALGGIWADQSWGRFWGWDPKENGAALIVLWFAWLQHGRVSNKLSPLAFAAGAAFVNVIVALAWFGVNLLSVGLHSYGFTSGMAAGLGLFCTAEAAIIGSMWLYAEKKSHAA